MNQKNSYRCILDTVPIPIFEMDKHFIIQLANREAHQKWPKIEEGKSHFCRVLRCEEEGPGNYVIEKTFQLKKSLSAEVETKAGEIFEIKTNYVEDIKEDSTRVVAHTLDVTAHKKVADALVESEKKYRTIFELSPETIVLLDKDGKLVEINERLSGALGYKREDILGNHFLELPFFTGESKGKAKEAFIQKMQGKDVPPYDLELTAVSGEKVIGRIVSTLLKDSDGEISYDLVIMSDMTERRRAEDELKKHRDHLEDLVKERTAELSEANKGLEVEITQHKKTGEALAETNRLLETILDCTHMLVAYLDPQFNFVRVNRVYAEADERDPFFFPGKNHFDLYPDPENEAIFRRVVETGEPYFAYAKAFEYAEHPERGVTYWDWSLIPIKNHQEAVTGLVFTLVNVTERIEAEEQIKASLAEKEVLLKEIHHRVKNNLQLINSLLNLQARLIPDEKNRSPFEECKNRVNSIALVHEKIYESNDLANINFGDYLRSLTTQFFTSYPASLSHIALKIDVEDILLPVDQAIPCALIVNELLSNSIKYGFPQDQKKEGKIVIQFKSGENGNATLVAADNGVGLPDNFDIDTSDTLGMHIISALVRQLYASIQVDGKKGTKFIIQFQISKK